MIEKFEKRSRRIPYSYWSCPNCGREVLDMQQLKEIVEKEKKLRKTPRAKISAWGKTLAIRIPKVIVEKQKIRPGEIATFLPEKSGFKVIIEKE
jgi:4-hydroxy-3-methylbut-2-en-1-yl diphosphate synthase IspG/GcpE